MKLVTAEQMRALDRRATEQYGIPSLLLMENAALSVYMAAADMLDDVSGKRVVIVAGPGNNGGDGFAVARHLHNAGADVLIAFYGERDKAKGDALTNIEIAEKMGLPIEAMTDAAPLVDCLEGVDLIADALLGTGIQGDVRPLQAEVISVINDSGVPVIAVDIPSGVNADTGAIGGAAVLADVTVTFALPKIGLLTYPGAEQVGRMVIADISIPVEALEDNDARVYAGDAEVARNAFPPRPTDSHKGLYGHVAIVAGSVGMTGAATLAADGALRIGTGLVTVAVPESLNDILEVKLTEAMTIPVPQGKARAFGHASLERVLEIVEKRDAVVIGPGFGRDEDTVRFTLELIRGLTRPAIVDADGLFAISKDVSVLKQRVAPMVITPHPGEMATLLGTSTADVQSNRLEVARSFAAEYNVVVVLKGAATVVAAPDGTAYINTTGSPGMATGGTGDVLSGMIGGLLAQRLDPLTAAAAAVYLHGLAGGLAADKLGEAAMIAGDVADCISDAIREVLSPAPEHCGSHCSCGGECSDDGFRH